MTWYQWALIAAVVLAVIWATCWAFAPLGNNREP